MKVVKVVMQRFEKIISESTETAEILLIKDRNDCYLDIKIQNQYNWFKKGFGDHHLAIQEKLFVDQEEYI